MLQDTTFWVLVSSALFLILAWKPLVGGILKALDARADKIRRDLDEAQSLREDAQSALAQYQRKQRDALKEADAILTAAKEEAERLRRRSMEELEASLKRRETQALEKIAQAEAQAIQQVREMAVEIAVAATERLLVQGVDETKDRSLVDQAIADLPARLH